MIRIVGQVPPILIGYYRPHKPKYLSKERVEQVQRVSIDVRKNQIHIYEQEESLYVRESDEEDDTNA